MEALTEAAIVAIRKIIRNSDLHSHKLRRESGLTSPRLMMLSAISSYPGATIGDLADRICLSQATATTILDRLEKDQLVQRYRSVSDKRRVHARLTEQGISALSDAPRPIASGFIEQFQRLKPHEQSAILSALLQTADMMDPRSRQESDPIVGMVELTRAS